MSEGMEAPAEGDGVTAGTLLRRAREAAGLHVATLAVALKVPVRKLEALEEDRYDQLSDAVFVRALASSVCRTLKVDPKPILDRLPQGGKPRLLPTDEGINAPFRAPGDGPTPGLLDQVTRPVGLVVVGLLLAALVIVLLPTVQREQALASKAAATPPAPQPTVVISQMASTPASAAAPESVASAAAPADAAASQTVALAPAAALSSVSAPAASAAAPAVATLPAASAVAAATASSSAAVPVSGTVVFEASAPSWVQVTDARGNTVLRQLLQAGESAGASGPAPLAVTVGSAQSTQVRVRGKPFDLSAVTRDNVARFEVK